MPIYNQMAVAKSIHVALRGKRVIATVSQPDQAGPCRISVPFVNTDTFESAAMKCLELLATTQRPWAFDQHAMQARPKYYISKHGTAFPYLPGWSYYLTGEAIACPNGIIFPFASQVIE